MLIKIHIARLTVLTVRSRIFQLSVAYICFSAVFLLYFLLLVFALGLENHWSYIKRCTRSKRYVLSWEIHELLSHKIKISVSCIHFVENYWLIWIHSKLSHFSAQTHWIFMAILNIICTFLHQKHSVLRRKKPIFDSAHSNNLNFWFVFLHMLCSLH